MNKNGMMIIYNDKDVKYQNQTNFYSCEIGHLWKTYPAERKIMRGIKKEEYTFNE